MFGSRDAVASVRSGQRRTAGSDGARFLSRAVLYPDLYLGYVALSALDVTLTCLILHGGGYEVNVVARWVIEQYDVWGAITLKFMTVICVVGLCEVVGRARQATGQNLAQWAVVVSLLPVIVGAAHAAELAAG